jgi:metal-responsive CopG/Arc/MetJ family transcriptional regulator
MATIKTAVSLRQSLFDRIEALAEERGVSRSQLVSQALEEYLRREESRRLLDRLNAAHVGESSPAEEELGRRRRRWHRRLVEGEW